VSHCCYIVGHQYLSKEHVRSVIGVTKNAYRICFGKSKGGWASGVTDTHPFHFSHTKKWAEEQNSSLYLTSTCISSAKLTFLQMLIPVYKCKQKLKAFHAVRDISNWETTGPFHSECLWYLKVLCKKTFLNMWILWGGVTPFRLVNRHQLFWGHAFWQTGTNVPDCVQFFLVGRFQLKCDGTRWRTGGEVKRKLANGVGSQYS